MTHATPTLRLQQQVDHTARVTAANCAAHLVCGNPVLNKSLGLVAGHPCCGLEQANETLHALPCTSAPGMFRRRLLGGLQSEVL
jgi:hypothetical protein